MKTPRIWLATLAALIGLLTLLPTLVGSVQTPQAQAAPPSPLQNIPITGTVVGGGAFSGTFDVVSFANQGGELVANGLLSGTLTDPAGVRRQVVNEYVTLPASLGTGNGPAAPAVACPILHLTLGPLDLNLLGLQVHLDRVVLDITAQGGPGNLLGNLLCAIAHLLDGGSPLDQIIALLNRIIDLLG